jgi:hypothetical protein
LGWVDHLWRLHVFSGVQRFGNETQDQKQGLLLIPCECENQPGFRLEEHHSENRFVFPSFPFFGRGACAEFQVSELFCEIPS